MISKVTMSVVITRRRGAGDWLGRMAAPLIYSIHTQSQNGEDTAAGSQYPAYGTWGRDMDMIISIL